MIQELFGSFLDGMNGIMIRLSNADFLTLAMVGGVVALLGYFLFKR